jgi:hypothetical protein
MGCSAEMVPSAEDYMKSFNEASYFKNIVIIRANRIKPVFVGFTASRALRGSAFVTDGDRCNIIRDWQGRLAPCCFEW